MTDKFGREIKLGDYLVYASCYSEKPRAIEMKFGRVVGFTPLGLPRILKLDGHRSRKTGALISGSRSVVLNEENVPAIYRGIEYIPPVRKKRKSRRVVYDV